MELHGKKIALFIENHYEDLEFWYPLLRLKEAGANVTVIGPTRSSFHSKHDYPAEADIAVTSARAAHFDGLVIPGGYAPDHMRRSEAMVNFVKDLGKQGKLVAAICHAGWMLASANIIRGVRVTGFPSIKDDLINAGGIYENSEVVHDKNIITSRWPADLPAFCRAIIVALAKVPIGVA
jgi:protease I